MTRVFEICKTVRIFEYGEDMKYQSRIRNVGRPERQVNKVMSIRFKSTMSCKYDMNMLTLTNVYVIGVPSVRRAITAVFR